jgi:ketosteroid isomerase-like protein
MGVRLSAAAAVSWLVCAGTLAHAADKPSEVAQLKQISDAWDKAIWTQNEKAIADNMADDFRMIDGYGELSDKKAFVTDLMDPKLRIHPYTVEEFTVRIYGDVALLSGRTDLTGESEGKSFKSSYRYTDIYARKNGAWKIVSVQITKFPAAKAGS